MNTKVLYIGTKHIGLTALKSLYKSAPDNLAGILTINDSYDVRTKLMEITEFSKKHKIPLFVLDKPSQLSPIIDSVKPDLCIVAGWYWIIKPQVLNKVPLGFVGLHGSLLPKYRGGSPLVWPIINGEKKSGISLFYLEEGMDTGDIIAQRSFTIREKDSIADILGIAEDLSVDLSKKYTPLLLQGKAPRKKQDHDNATYCAVRKPEDGRINWRKTNREVHNFIRAQTTPYPGAFTFVKGEIIYLLSSGVFEPEYFGVPGTVVQVNKDHVLVSCGTGAVIIYDVKPANSIRQAANKVMKFGTRLE